MAQIEARVERAGRLAFLVDGDEARSGETLIAWQAVTGIGFHGREGGGETAFTEVPVELHNVSEAVTGDFRADAPGDIEKVFHFARAEAVIAAPLKEDAIAGPAAQLVALVANAALADGADAGGAFGDDQAADLEWRMRHG
jgi:hypothetical protein